MPEWAKTGPIDRRNYVYRAEAHCAQKSPERKGLHPTVKRDSTEGREWIAYFRNHLGGLPWCAQMLINGDLLELTVPELQPEWFDPSYVPMPVPQKKAGHA